MARSPLSARGLARAAAALLPAAVRARLAAYRFGYSRGARPFTVGVGGTPAAPVVAIPPDIELRLDDTFAADIAYHFVDNGDSRDEMRAFVEASRRSPPDTLLVDVGAHKGLFALVHCASAPRHRALLLEPSRSAAAIAERMLAAHGFGTRSGIRLAGAGERAGVLHVVDGAESFIHVAEPGAPGAYAVDFTTIDEECARTGLPGLVKIDVEGAEGRVLRGARQILARAKPVVFLELHLDVIEQNGESVADVLEPLVAAGYRFSSVGGARLSVGALGRSLRAIVRLVATA